MKNVTFALEIAVMALVFGMVTVSMACIGSVDTRGNVEKIILDLNPSVSTVANR